MNKLFLAALCSILGLSTAHAQQADLFPELKGQFKPAVKTVSPSEPPVVEENASAKVQKIMSEMQNGTPNQPVQLDMIQQTPNEVEIERGKISLSMENTRGTMAYARNYSYCFSEAVVRNDTSQKLNNLTITLTYGKTPTKLVFSGINKKSKKSQQFMMVGEDCALIKSTPKYTIDICKLGTLNQKACEGRFKFIPPQ